MHATPILRISGILLTLFSITMLTPVPFALRYGEDTVDSFLTAFAVTAGAGLCAWLPVMRSRRELRNRDGFVITVLFYLSLGLFGALPLWLEPGGWNAYTDAACKGWAAWASSCWRWRSCRCSGSAACSSTARRCPAP